MNLLGRSLLRVTKLTVPLGYRFSMDNANFDKLSKDFVRQKDMAVFAELIRTSNNTLDNINYFRIFKLLTESNSQIKHFQDLFRQVNLAIEKKPDNIIFLLANIKSYLAKMYEKQQLYYDALNCLEDAMDVLEYSLIPPVLFYYQIYRYYGTLQFRLGKKEEAREALLESVTTIEKFVEQSDDHVTNSNNSKNQAYAYCLLAELDPSKQAEWLEKCFNTWQEYEGDKTKLKQYAESIVIKAKGLYKESKQKGQEFLMGSMYRFKDGELKDFLRKSKSELSSQQ